MPEDYFLRLIDQVAIMLSQIASREVAGDNSGAKAEVNAQCRQAMGLDISQVRRMSPEALAQLLNTAAGLRQSRAVLLSELLLKDAEMHPEDEGRVSLNRLQAFCLIASVVDSLDVNDQRVYRSKLEVLIEQLRPLQSNPYIAAKLREYESERKA